MRKPKLCGNNQVYLPESGCSDCEQLEYRIGIIEDWIENNFLTADEIIALTPIECEDPYCSSDSRACYGHACCMIVSCEGGDVESFVCDAKVCEAIVQKCK